LNFLYGPDSGLSSPITEMASATREIEVAVAVAVSTEGLD
jgi:hypothetical protein